MVTLQCADFYIVDEIVHCVGAHVTSAGFFPALTESEALGIATAVALLFATVFGIRQISRVIR